jgi:hypothetical protein
MRGISVAASKLAPMISNQHITEQKNPHIKFKKNSGFTLSTPKQEESDAEPLQQFFPGRRFRGRLEWWSV